MKRAQFTWKKYLFFAGVLGVFAVYQLFSDPHSVQAIIDWPDRQKRIEELTQQVRGTKDARGFEQVVVNRVLDGDTIELSDGRTIRYVGVDTPELHHPKKGEECFGQEAADENTRLVDAKVIQLEVDKSDKDRYGRSLRLIWEGPVLINKELAEGGFAFARTFAPDKTFQNDFEDAEARAKAAHKGLWKKCIVKDEHTQQIRKPK